jgi:signal transduction histidine kinase
VPEQCYSLREIMTDPEIFSKSPQRLVILKVSSENPEEKFLLMSRNDLIFNNKDCCVLIITDLTSVRKVGSLQNQNQFLSDLNAKSNHEMNTPLNCIIQLAQKLVHSHEKKSRVWQIAKMVSHSACSMKFVIKDMLDRSLLQNNKLEPVFTSQNLNYVINETVEVMRFIASNKNLKIYSIAKKNGDKMFRLDVNRV